MSNPFHDVDESTWLDVIHKMDEVYSKLIQDEIELEKKNAELQQAYQELQNAHERLKYAQMQLLHSEKPVISCSILRHPQVFRTAIRKQPWQSGKKPCEALFPMNRSLAKDLFQASFFS